MDRKAAIAEETMSTVIYLILAVLFLIGMLSYVNAQRNGAAVWEDFYAKELAKNINLAQPGDEIILNVQKATQIAAKSQIADSKTMFQFDNDNKQICVKLESGRKSCYSYFNEVSVLNWKVNYGVPENLLVIKIGGTGNA